MKNTKFWNWQEPDETDTGQERVLELYGTIAEEGWLDDNITPKMFHDELFAGSGPVTIWLSSPGGDVIAASRIYSMLMDYKNDVTIKIDGIAASAASVIAMAGTKVLMAPTSLLMVHNPATAAFGDHNEMQKAIEMLEEVKESIINAYELKTGLTRAKLSHYMENETWFNAQKAIELGFADDILTDEKRQVNDSAYSFSGRKAENLLLNKLTAKYKTAMQPEEKNVKDETEAAIEPIVAEMPVTEIAAQRQPKQTGTPIADLEKRLNLLK